MGISKKAKNAIIAALLAALGAVLGRMSDTGNSDKSDTSHLLKTSSAIYTVKGHMVDKVMRPCSPEDCFSYISRSKTGAEIVSQLNEVYGFMGYEVNRS